MEISLLVKNDLIEDIGYQCKSCVYCQASVSMLSSKIKNKKIDQIKHLFSSVESFFDNTEIKINKEWEDFKKILNKKNISRKECLLLPFRTISKALKFKLWSMLIKIIFLGWAKGLSGNPYNNTIDEPKEAIRNKPKDVL